MLTIQISPGTTPISSDAIALLQKIIKGIESGELSHSQCDFHCGSSHCIAGWVEMFSLAEAGIEGEYIVWDNWDNWELHEETKWMAANGEVAQCSPLVEPFSKDASNSVMYGISGFAVSKLGLTKQEGLLLFDAFTPFWLIQKIVNLLSEGYRLNRYIYISDRDEDLDSLVLREADEDTYCELSPDEGDLSQLFDYCGS